MLLIQIIATDMAHASGTQWKERHHVIAMSCIQVTDVKLVDVSILFFIFCCSIYSMNIKRQTDFSTSFFMLI